MQRSTECSGRCADDHGAVIIEAALVLPLILVFLAGIVDFGVGFRNRTLIQSASRNGARVGAAAVSSPSADQLAISTFNAGLVGAARLTIEKVIIYEATGGGSEPSNTCKSITPQPTGAGNSSANCNVYGRTQVENSSTTFTGAPTYLIGSTVSSNCTSGWNRYWCAGGASGSNERTANLDGVVDSLGLYAEVAYEPFTGVFATSAFVITDWTVMRLEPAPG